MATPFLQQEGVDRVLSLKFVPTALVPVVWDWQFQKADGPGGYVALRKQLSWGRGRSSREMFSVLEYGGEHSRCTRKDKSWSWYSTTKGCQELWALHLLVLPVKGFPVARKTPNF